MSIVYLDIETIPGDTAPGRDEVKVPANYKKQETIDKYIDEHLDESWHKQSLDSMKGQIFCIGMAVDDSDPKVFDSLDEFVVALDGLKGHCSFIGHNILTFDAKWLFRHLVKAGFNDVAQKFDFNPYRGNIHDTMLIWGCGDRQDRVSLDNLAQFLGVGNKTPGIDGSKVWGMVKDGLGDEVKAYCADDVELTRRVYKRLAWGL